MQKNKEKLSIKEEEMNVENADLSEGRWEATDPRCHLLPQPLLRFGFKATPRMSQKAAQRTNAWMDEWMDDEWMDG